MEKLKVKHDHTLTNIIKVCIFALFLILPFLVFLPTGLYYAFNEHAVNETTTEVDIHYKYQTNEVNSVDDLIVGNIYHINKQNITEYGDIAICKYIGGQRYSNQLKIQFDNDGTSILRLIDSQTWNIVVYTGVTYQNTYTLNSNDIYFTYYDNINVDYLPFIDNNIDPYFDTIENVVITEDVNQSITSSMNNAWQDTWETPLFNWTDNQNFGFTIKAFTNVFGISEESKITNYLTYILTLTAIYVVFDIVLEIFTKLTHIFNEK